jgi:hypothetical protein
MKATYAFGLALFMAAALPVGAPRATEADKVRLIFASTFPGGMPLWDEHADIT